MTGLTPQQLIDVTAFIQKYHPFGMPKEPLEKIPYGYCIKYIDAVYDTREADYWSVTFRGGFTDCCFSTNGHEGGEFESLYDWIMAFLKGDWEFEETKKEREREKRNPIPVTNPYMFVQDDFREQGFRNRKEKNKGLVLGSYKTGRGKK